MTRPWPFPSVAKILLAAVLAIGTPVGAQEPSAPRARAFEAMAGIGWDRSSDLGSGSATLTGPSVPLTLFRTETRVAASTGYDLRLAYNLSRSVAVEAGLSRRHPALEVRVSDDAEGASSSVLSSNALDVYRIEGTLVVHLNGLRAGAVLPYVAAGAGQARQLDAESVLIQTTGTVHLSGGAKSFFFSRGSGFVRGIGLRGEVRVRVDGRSLDLARKARTSMSAALAAVVAF